jgi:acyl-coenzyme A thioesterase PaaI-like protein
MVRLPGIASMIGMRNVPRRDGQIELAMDPYPELCVYGAPRISVLALLVDVTAGYQTQAAIGDNGQLSMTRDLSIWVPPHAASGPIRAIAEILHAGPSSAIVEVALVDEGGQKIGRSVLSFARVNRGVGQAEPPRLEEIEWTFDRVSTDLVDWAGIEIVEPEHGILELPVGDRVRNNWGMRSVQGAVPAIMGEVAAEAMATAVLGAPYRVLSLDVRYLVGGQIGPLRTTSSFVGEPSGGLMRIGIYDMGRDDKLSVSVLASVVSRPEADTQGTIEEVRSDHDRCG